LSNFNYPFNPNGPCRECHDRHPACHDKCESYISYKKEYDKKQKRIRADKYLHSLSFPMSTHPKRREL